MNYRLPRIDIRESVWVARLTGNDLRDLCNDFPMEKSFCRPPNTNGGPVELTKAVKFLWGDSIVS